MISVACRRTRRILAAIGLLMCPAAVLSEGNPDAPVGVVGVTMFFNQWTWGDYEVSATRTGGDPRTEEDPERRTVIRDVGIAAVIPVHDRVTIRGSAARGTSRDEYTALVFQGGTLDSMAMHLDQKSWEFGASLTIWLGRGD